MKQKIMNLFFLFCLLVPLPEALASSQDSVQEDLACLDETSVTRGRSKEACKLRAKCLGVVGSLNVNGKCVVNGTNLSSVANLATAVVTSPVGADAIAAQIAATPAAAAGIAGAIGKAGLSGPPGPAGATGATGATGSAGAAGADADNTLPAAQYVTLGGQGPVNPGQPFTYTTAVISSPDISASPGLGGTIFTLVQPGYYEINWQMTIPVDGGVAIYAGPSVAGLQVLYYTLVGKDNDGQLAGSAIIETTTANSVVSINAAPGNTPPPSGIVIPQYSDAGTNLSATTVSFKKIS